MCREILVLVEPLSDSLKCNPTMALSQTEAVSPLLASCIVPHISELHPVTIGRSSNCSTLPAKASIHPQLLQCQSEWGQLWSSEWRWLCFLDILIMNTLIQPFDAIVRDEVSEKICKVLPLNWAGAGTKDRLWPEMQWSEVILTSCFPKAPLSTTIKYNNQSVMGDVGFSWSRALMGLLLFSECSWATKHHTTINLGKVWHYHGGISQRILAAPIFWMLLSSTPSHNNQPPWQMIEDAFIFAVHLNNTGVNWKWGQGRSCLVPQRRTACFERIQILVFLLIILIAININLTIELN